MNNNTNISRSGIINKSVINDSFNNINISHDSCVHCGICARRGSRNIERHLMHLALQSSSAMNLYSIWDLDKKELTEKLNNISRPFKTYSDHGPSHSEKILERISQVLGDRLCLLNATDTFMLLETAYRHDTGMFVTYNEIIGVLDSGEFKTKLAQLKFSPDKSVRDAAYYISDISDEFHKDSIKVEERIKWTLKTEKCFNIIISEYFRQKHAERSGQAILTKPDFAVSNNIIINRIREIIALICTGHTKNADSIYELQRFETGLDNDVAHPRFIQMLLRLGDLLDLDNNRFDTNMLTQWGDDTPLATKAHNIRHEAVKHLYISPEIIEVTAKFDCKEFKPFEKEEEKKFLFPKAEAEFYEKADEISKEISDLIECKENISGNDIIDLINKNKNFSEKAVEYRKRKEEEEEEHLIKYNACIIAANWFSWLESDLEFFAKKWDDIVPANFPSSIPKYDKDKMKILWQDEELEIENFNLKYEISQKRAFDIISDTGLYNNDIRSDLKYGDNKIKPGYFIFLRELVQNAMDSMKIQVFRYLREGRYGDPKQFGNDMKQWKVEDVIPAIGEYITNLYVEVKIYYSSKDNKYIVEVIDTGTGIDELTLKEMRWIGNPRTPEKEKVIDSMPSWLRPNGAFGVGMQSIFGIVDKFKAESGSRTDHEKRDLYFNSLKYGGCLFAVKKNKKPNTPPYKYGTTIRVEIEKDRIDKIESKTNNWDKTFSFDFIDRFRTLSKQIDEMMGQDLFPIRVRFFVDEVELLHNEKPYPQVFFPHAFEKLINKNDNKWGFRYYYMEPTNGSITFWYYYSKKNILLQMKLKDIKDKTNLLLDVAGDIDLFYRGMRVPGVNYLSVISYPCWDIEAYIWDYDPADVLQISRNFIKPEKEPEIVKSVTKAADEAIAHLIDEIAKAGNADLIYRLNRDQKNALALSLFITKISNPWINGNPETARKCTEILNINPLVDFEIEGYEYICGREEFTKHHISARDLFSFDINEIRFIHRSSKPTLNTTFKPVEETTDFYCLPDFLSEYMMERYSASYLDKITTFIKDIKEDEDAEIFIYTYSDQKGNFASISKKIEESIYDRACENAVNSNGKNLSWIVIPGLIRYRDLCIELDPSELEFFSCVDCFKSAGIFLILPFTCNALRYKKFEEFKNISSDEQFNKKCEEEFKKDEYNNLFDFIKKKKNYTDDEKKDIIEKGYKHMIKEMFL